VITARGLNRATLSRQLLLEREPLTVVDAVRRVVALQAQHPASPYLALWNRIKGFAPAELDAAFTGRAVVKATLMRITLHAVHAGDYPVLRAAMQPTLYASRLGVRTFRVGGKQWRALPDRVDVGERGPYAGPCPPDTVRHVAGRRACRSSVRAGGGVLPCVLGRPEANGRRRELYRLLSDPSAAVIVVEHLDRLAGFGVEHLDAVLSASGRRLVVLDPGEAAGDLVRDVTEVLTLMCVRLCGRRAAKSRAARAVAVVTGESAE
jgi:hypothetical protein